MVCLCSMRSRTSARKTGRLGLMSPRGMLAHRCDNECRLLTGPPLGCQPRYLEVASVWPRLPRAEAGFRVSIPRGRKCLESGWCHCHHIRLVEQRQSPDAKRGSRFHFAMGERSNHLGLFVFKLSYI